MKRKLTSRILLSLGVVFVLGSAITQVRSEEDKFPLITIHSSGDVIHGKASAFVLDMNPRLLMGGVYVNFSVAGTAKAGIDYVPLVSPAYIGQSGYGVILVQPLPNRRASSQSFSIVVKLEPGPGYELGEPKSAQMMIKP
ncbi:MAG TPA: hypothetical protein VH330_11360 [Candidatus Udaeobacter sp.]|jgi:hypothetical protein